MALGTPNAFPFLPIIWTVRLVFGFRNSMLLNVFLGGTNLFRQFKIDFRFLRKLKTKRNSRKEKWRREMKKPQI
jgi:hypothetical protein